MKRRRVVVEVQIAPMFWLTEVPDDLVNYSLGFGRAHFRRMWPDPSIRTT